MPQTFSMYLLASQTHMRNTRFMRKVKIDHPAVEIGLAASSGALWVVAFPNFNAWYLAWVAMVPVMVIVERATSTRRALLLAWLAGIVMNVGGFYWLVGTLEQFGSLSRVSAVALLLLFASYQALRFLLFGWIIRSIRRSLNLSMTIIAPLAIVTAELFVPVIFPFYMGVALAWRPSLIQTADLTGPLGISAVLLMVNGAIYDLLSMHRHRLLAATMSGIVMASVLSYGYLRMEQMETRRAGAKKIKVGIVQPNAVFNHASAGGMTPIPSVVVARLRSHSTALEKSGAELIVWPETSYPYHLSRVITGKTQHSSEFEQVHTGFNSPLLMGVATREPSGSNAGLFNSALMLERDKGLVATYDKNFLLMFGEYVPGTDTFPELRTYVPQSFTHFRSGEQAVAFTFETADHSRWRISPTICLEDILPEFGRKVAELRPHLLVNLTNDVWFGDTAAPWQHFALSVFRSIELRTEMVRSTTTGISAHVSATGEVYNHIPPVKQSEQLHNVDGLLVDAALMEGGNTPYAKSGDVFGYGSAALTICLLLMPYYRRVWLRLPRTRGDIH
jgi:apolipoprotein N-acyltransferase